MKIRLCLKSNLCIISDSGMIHSPLLGSIFFKNTYRLLNTGPMQPDVGSVLSSVSYDSVQISCIFNSLKLSAARFPASPIH